MNSLNLAARVLLFAFTLVPIWASAQLLEVSTASLLQQMKTIKEFPRFRNYTTHFAGSTNTTGANDDRGFYPLCNISEKEKLIGADAPRNTHTHIPSSNFPYDKIGANEHVLAYDSGPGAIVRMWTTDAAAQTIRIYMDGKVWTQRFSDFFTGSFFGITEPYFDFQNGMRFGLKPFSRITYGSTVSYMGIPMPYQSYMIVTIESNGPDPDRALYYQVNYIKFPQGTRVRTFDEKLGGTERLLLEDVANTWVNPPIPRITKTYAANVPAYDPARCPRGGCPQTAVFQYDGKGQFNLLSLKITGTSKLRNVVLRMYFDGHQEPDIEAPLADFRGNPFEYGGIAVRRDGAPLIPKECGPPPQDADPDPNPGQFKGKLVGNAPYSIFTRMAGDLDTFYFTMPMPFFEKAIMSIENGSGEHAFVEVGVAFEDREGDRDFSKGNYGYLRSQFYHERTKRGRAHHWMKNGGTRGHFMGVVQGYVDPLSGYGYLEGDEQFRTDSGQSSPVPSLGTIIAPWNGTGAEDYFNSGYYYHGRPSQRQCNPLELLPPAVFQQPTYGLMLKTYGAGHISTYKWHILDGPTWTSSIEAQMEHGANNNNPGTYFSSLAFWYASDEPQKTRPIYKASDLEWPRRVKDQSDELNSGYWFGDRRSTFPF